MCCCTDEKVYQGAGQHERHDAHAHPLGQERDARLPGEGLLHRRLTEFCRVRSLEERKNGQYLFCAVSRPAFFLSSMERLVEVCHQLQER